MLPALLNSRPPAHIVRVYHDDHALQNLSPNGQISSLFPLNFSGFSSINESKAMNPSNANSGPSELSNSSNTIGLNKPGLGSGKPAIGSALGRSKPRMAKLRRHTASDHSRSTQSSESGDSNPGFNPFRSISGNSIPSFTRSEMGSSVLGSSNLGNIGNETFVFGANREKSSTSLSCKMGNSSGLVANKIVDDMMKLKIGIEKQEVGSATNSALNLNVNDKEGRTGAEGLDKETAVFASMCKESGTDKSVESKLRDEMRKLKIEGSGNVESTRNVEAVKSNSSAHDKTNFSFRNVDDVPMYGTSVASGLPNELKKLNIKDAREVDESCHKYNADDTEKSVFGDINKGSNSLADNIKNLNIKDSVNTSASERKEVNLYDGGKSSSVFGSSKGDSGSLDDTTENTVANEMEKLKIGRDVAYNTGQRQFGFESSTHSLKGPLGNMGDKRFQDIRGSIPTEFTFQAGPQGQNWRCDNVEAPHVEFTTPNQKGNLFAGLDKKLEFSAKKESTKDARSKKKRGKMRKPTVIEQLLGQDFVSRKSNSEDRPDSFEAYSPMDISPYHESFADDKVSRETSVTSEEAFNPYMNNASGESRPTDSNDATDDNLVVATQNLDINDGDTESTGMKVEGSEYGFDEVIVAEDPSEESVLGTETESFKSADELLDYSTDSFVTAADTEVSSSSRIERQDSDGRMQSSSAMEDVGGTNFTFAASSFAQGQLSSTLRHNKKKNRLKAVHETCSSTPNKAQHKSFSMPFFPRSDTPSLLSPRRDQKGGLITSFSKNVGNSEAVEEQELKQETISAPTASITAQEACEKWRLRGNQAYANGNMSSAEDYYTRGIQCISENENSRGCLRALMLCYSNRAATRMSIGRMREALADCIKAAAIDPTFFRVQVRAANCYLALGEVENASLHFMKCLQSGHDACADRKLVLEASEGLEKAEKVLDNMKQSAELLQRRTSSDAERALGLICEALTISSYCEKLLEMKADALSMLRKYEELIQLCEQTLSSAETNSATSSLMDLGCSEAQKIPSYRLWRLRLIMKSLFYLGRLEEALDFLKKQGGLVPTNEESKSKTLESLLPLAGTIRELVCHKAAGNEAFQSGRHAEAVEHYTAALSCTVESRPFAAVCFCNRAAAYKAMGQIIDAIADCSLAIALDGSYLKAISRRATLFEMIRDYERATVDLRRLVSLLMKQVEDNANQSGASDRMSSLNELRQAQQRLSVMEEEARKEIPLNMYLILGVDPSVTASEIKKAYRKAALRHHPDKAGQSLARSENGDDGLWKEVVEEAHKDADRLFKMIGEAYAVLSDPAKRSRYDLEEETRNAQKRGNGGSTSRTHTDVHNYPFERSSNRRQWQEVWRSYGNSQSRGSGTTRSNLYS